MKARKRMALLLATAVLGGGVAAAGPAAATAQTHGDAPAHLSSTVGASATKCAGWKSVRLDGNPAGMRYLECWRTYQGKKQSSGAIYLWDNKHDGLEACGKITIGRWFKDWCWSNESQHSPEYISGWHDGADAKFGLFLAG
ncbi:hypothetical protein [Streptomyces sp. NPDC093261]|uniref:hypothetical protein n=1 Tax=Streptomyces sp. NPDC093261 TaxID=3366037 RepID=UPI0038063622